MLAGSNNHVLVPKTACSNFVPLISSAGGNDRSGARRMTATVSTAARHRGEDLLLVSVGVIGPVAVGGDGMPLPIHHGIGIAIAHMRRQALIHTYVRRSTRALSVTMWVNRKAHIIVMAHITVIAHIMAPPMVVVGGVVGWPVPLVSFFFFFFFFFSQLSLTWGPEGTPRMAGLG